MGGLRVALLGAVLLCSSSALAQETPVARDGAPEGDQSGTLETKDDSGALEAKDEAPLTQKKLSTAPSAGSEEITQATASAEEQARAAFKAGDSKYLEGDYQGAADAFQEAYLLSGKIEMLFNLANAYERLGKYLEASFALQSYLPHAPLATQPKLQRRMVRLKQRAEEAAQQKAELLGSPTTAGAPVPPVQEQPIPLVRVAGVGLVTLGVAGIIAGTAFGISALKTRNQLKEQCQDGRRLCPPESETLIRRDRAHSLVADVALIGGAALSAAGIYLLLKKTETTELAVTTRGLGATFGGRF